MGADRTGLFEIAVCARLSGCPDDYLRGDLCGAGAVDRCGKTDVVKAIWTAVGYTVLLCFCLFKTSSLPLDTGRTPRKGAI